MSSPNSMTSSNILQNANILVTGGAGFVGSNLVQKLLASDVASVMIVDNFLSSEPWQVPIDPRITVLRGSISDDDLLESLPRDMQYIFHLATFHGNQNSIARPLDDHFHNTLTSLKLFNYAGNFKSLKALVYASAGCTVAEKTFGEADATQEDAPVSLFLDSPYQLSKIFGEFYGNYFFRHSSLPFVKARFQNVYGPGEVLGAGEWRGTAATVWRNVVPTFIFKALQREALPLENEGIATRDFIFVRDVVDGLMACATRGVPGETYNLASGREISIRTLAEQINKLTSNSAGIHFLPKRSWDSSGRRFGATAKAHRELDFLAKTEFEVGLQETISWTRENLEAISKCISKHKQYLKIPSKT